MQHVLVVSWRPLRPERHLDFALHGGERSPELMAHVSGETALVAKREVEPRQHSVEHRDEPAILRGLGVRHDGLV